MKRNNCYPKNYPSYRGKEKRNRHHLLNKVNGGESTKQNLLWIKIERHRSWHFLFDNLNLEEVIQLLIRVKRAKENQTN